MPCVTELVLLDACPFNVVVVWGVGGGGCIFSFFTYMDSWWKKFIEFVRLFYKSLEDICILLLKL